MTRINRDLVFDCSRCDEKNRFIIYNNSFKIVLFNI